MIQISDHYPYKLRHCRQILMADGNFDTNCSIISNVQESATSAILPSIVFASKAIKGLQETVSSLRSNQRTVRELREELEALNEVLTSLQQTAAGSDFDFRGLVIPLRQCGRACEDVKETINRCTEHSGTSFRDRAKLRYMGDDISGFNSVLATYKCTIIIAVGAANLLVTTSPRLRAALIISLCRRTPAITTNFQIEFKQHIANTISDLKDFLQATDEKLETLSLQGQNISDEDATERKQIQEERNSAQQSLSICTQASDSIEHVESFNAFENTSTSQDVQCRPSCSSLDP